MKNNLNGYKNVILKMIVGSSTSKRDGFQAKPLSCRSTDSDILSDKAYILNIWKE
jgi:hypothetical protein